MNRPYVLFLSLCLSQIATAEAADLSVVTGSLEQVVCLDSGSLNVRGADLHQVLFQVPAFERVKVFQGWGENKKIKIDGVTRSYVKVQFSEREARGVESIGWIAESFVKPRSQCPGAKTNEPAIPGSTLPVANLNDPNCCAFPLAQHPSTSFETGMGRFGAGRDGGARTHAACDLYKNKNDPIRSVAPGTVLRDKYAFYQGTYALEVKHAGGFVVRYGEITGKNAAGISAGKKIQSGQELGYMGKVNSNCCEPMLHFELYSGTKTGALSQGGTSFQRRSDLINPTKYLLRWEANAL